MSLAVGYRGFLLLPVTSVTYLPTNELSIVLSYVQKRSLPGISRNAVNMNELVFIELLSCRNIKLYDSSEVNICTSEVFCPQ